MRPNQPTLFNSVNAASSQNSQAIQASQILCGSIQTVFTGSNVTGTLQVQVSNDPPTVAPSNNYPVNWSNLPGASGSVTASGTNLIVLPNPPFNFAWIRLAWTYTSGTGNMTSTGQFGASN